MDWSCPVLTDEVWSRLLSRPWLASHRRLRYRSPLHMWFTIANVHAEVRRRHPLSALYRLVERTYLEAVPELPLRSLIIHNDFASREFLGNVERQSRTLNVEVVCAGGYAAWRLERHIDAESGRRDLPRSVRSTTFRECDYMDEFWFPRDIDLYVTETDADLVMTVVQESYVRFMTSVYGECSFAFIPGAKDETKWSSDDEERSASHRLFLDHIRENHDGLSNRLRTQMERHVSACISYPWRAAATTKMWTLTCSAAIGAEPSIVTVWNVTGKRDGEPLRQLLTTSMFLSHMTVQLCVTGGELQYRGTKQSLRDAIGRKLRIVNTNSFFHLYHVLGCYLRRGFEFATGGAQGVSTDTFCVLQERHADYHSLASSLTITA
jgi:hypothetical protein